MRLVFSLAVLFALITPAPVALGASAEKNTERVASIVITPSAIQFNPKVNHESISLSVRGPDGEVYVQEYQSGRNPVFSITQLPRDETIDGTYVYELRVTPRISSQIRQQLKDLRERGDEAEARKVQKNAGIFNTLLQSGAVSIRNGTFLIPDESEGTTEGTRPTPSQPSTDSAAPQTGTHAGRAPLQPVVNDQVIPDDLIVQSSLCAGFDCVDGESFGTDTIKVKENNTRIKFEDTSASAGFASNDWQLTANDQPTGGLNKFSIDDITGAKVPFTIEAGAATNSLYVDGTGRVGFRTSTPGLDLHTHTGNTPALRFEQDNTGGFTAQTWDVAGNEANFFIRDVTGGSRLSFRIRPGAPTSSIDINADGDVGIGTASPTQKLHASTGPTGENANTIVLVDNLSATGLSAAGVLQARADTAVTSLIAHGSGRTLVRFGQTLAGFSEMLTASGNGLIVGTVGATPLILGTGSTARMTIASGGAITVPGNFTVSGLKNFATVDPADSNQALYYTALEGPEAGTYFRGTARTVNREAVIELPGYFARLTESERMTVQLTPVGGWGQLYVAHKSPDRLVIKLAEGSSDVEFDYFVQGVRKGYLDYEVERKGAFPVAQ